MSRYPRTAPAKAEERRQRTKTKKRPDQPPPFESPANDNGQWRRQWISYGNQSWRTLERPPEISPQRWTNLCLLLEALSYHLPYPYPSMEALAERMTRSVRTVERTVKLAREVGLIETYVQTRHGYWESYAYRLTFIDQPPQWIAELGDPVSLARQEAEDPADDWLQRRWRIDIEDWPAHLAEGPSCPQVVDDALPDNLTGRRPDNLTDRRPVSLTAKEPPTGEEEVPLSRERGSGNAAAVGSASGIRQQQKGTLSETREETPLAPLPKGHGSGPGEPEKNPAAADCDSPVSDPVEEVLAFTRRRWQEIVAEKPGLAHDLMGHGNGYRKWLRETFFGPDASDPHSVDKVEAMVDAYLSALVDDPVYGYNWGGAIELQRTTKKGADQDVTFGMRFHWRQFLSVKTLAEQEAAEREREAMLERDRLWLAEGVAEREAAAVAEQERRERLSLDLVEHAVTILVDFDDDRDDDGVPLKRRTLADARQERRAP